MREEAEAEFNKEMFCILGGSGEQACSELQFVLESTGHRKAGPDEFVQQNLRGGDPNLDL